MSTLLVADIGGTTVKIGFVVEGVPQTYQRVFPTSHLRRPDPVAGLAEMISLAIDEAKLQPHAIVSTVPGFLDKTATRVLLAVNIPELNGCALVDALARVLGIPVILERDAVLSLIGEHAAGGCRGAQSVLGFFFRNRCRRGVSPERTRLPRVWLGARGRTHALSRVASMAGS